MVGAGVVGAGVVGAGVVGAGVVGAGVVGAGVADDDEELGVRLGARLVVLEVLLQAVTTAAPAMTAATTIFLIPTGYNTEGPPGSLPAGLR